MLRDSQEEQDRGNINLRSTPLTQTARADNREPSAIILHEARNSLAVVRVGLSSCRRIGLPPILDRRLEMIVDEVERLTHLLSDLSAYDRCSVLQVKLLPLQKFARELLELAQYLPVARSRRIRLVGEQTEVFVRGDRDKLKQVFLNLIKNACEAISPGEMVTWLIESDEAKQIVSLNIHNGGKTIPPDILAALPCPFVTTKVDGRGLGLTVAKQIAEAHGGKLLIRSSEAEGTVVSVQLPIAKS